MSLSKDRFFLLAQRSNKEERPFDKLRAGGLGGSLTIH